MTKTGSPDRAARLLRTIGGKAALPQRPADLNRESTRFQHGIRVPDVIHTPAPDDGDS